jgi:hypothetical protein
VASEIAEKPGMGDFAELIHRELLINDAEAATSIRETLRVKYL